MKNYIFCVAPFVKQQVIYEFTEDSGVTSLTDTINFDLLDAEKIFKNIISNTVKSQEPITITIKGGKNFESLFKQKVNFTKEEEKLITVNFI